MINKFTINLLFSKIMSIGGQLLQAWVVSADAKLRWFDKKDFSKDTGVKDQQLYHVDHSNYVK